MREYPILTVLLTVFIVLAVMYYLNPSAFKRNGKDDEVKCQVRAANGTMVTITGKEGDADFENQCKQGSNQPVYLTGYTYPFYYYRTWFPRYYGYRWYTYPTYTIS